MRCAGVCVCVAAGTGVSSTIAGSLVISIRVIVTNEDRITRNTTAIAIVAVEDKKPNHSNRPVMVVSPRTNKRVPECRKACVAYCFRTCCSAV